MGEILEVAVVSCLFWSLYFNYLQRDRIINLENRNRELKKEIKENSQTIKQAKKSTLFKGEDLSIEKGIGLAFIHTPRGDDQ